MLPLGTAVLAVFTLILFLCFNVLLIVLSAFISGFYELLLGGTQKPFCDGGMLQLDGGMSQLSGGTLQLDGGTCQLSGGTFQLDGGSCQLSGGMFQLDGGTC
ncbi:hypothetical protein DWB61_11345 [Ancylomarina euxinus]|uniref:Uncharacterized protein n=1 Tax=Ancylomarina euxinus TaxID=2283627 RepID=A0A425Y075_9BACT|nr:hypothetical protein DWB61_11345 [Ancylomarina euxinus]